MELNDIEVDASDSRREAVLEAAIGVFARYGFRKSSMDEVARAAGVSRQGLYLHFADKEELFRTAVAYKLQAQLTAARRRSSMSARAWMHGWWPPAISGPAASSASSAPMPPI